MSYHVYENWTVHKAKIHFSECPDCNHGSGKQPVDSGKNGRWLGPFPTYEAAQAEAEATGQPISDCGNCNPH